MQRGGEGLGIAFRKDIQCEQRGGSVVEVKEIWAGAEASVEEGFLVAVSRWRKFEGLDFGGGAFAKFI